MSLGYRVFPILRDNTAILPESGSASPSRLQSEPVETSHHTWLCRSVNGWVVINLSGGVAPATRLQNRA